MKVLRRTPRTDLTNRALLAKMGHFYEQLASELGLEKYLIDEALTRFAWLSTRTTYEDGEIDFALVVPGDSEKIIVEKFMVYLDSACIDVIEAAARAISEHDTPSDKALAPVLPEDSDPN